jgi:hypothetical protein
MTQLTSTGGDKLQDFFATYWLHRVQCLGEENGRCTRGILAWARKDVLLKIISNFLLPLVCRVYSSNR